MNTRRVAKLFNGLFAVNKPCGVLSTQVVYVLRNILKEKVGHGGTLGKNKTYLSTLLTYNFFFNYLIIYLYYFFLILLFF